jgi:hypothetical protein
MAHEDPAIDLNKGDVPDIDKMIREVKEEQAQRMMPRTTTHP